MYTRATCKYQFEVILKVDYIALFVSYWQRQVITIPGMSWAGGALSDWQYKVMLEEDTLNMRVSNWYAIDKQETYSCCPKNLDGFKIWLGFWIRDYIKNILRQKAQELTLSTKPPKPPNFLSTGPGLYKIEEIPMDEIRAMVPVKFTVTMKFKCADTDECECRIICDKYNDIIPPDVPNIRIQPRPSRSGSEDEDLAIAAPPSVPNIDLNEPNTYFNEAII